MGKKKQKKQQQKKGRKKEKIVKEKGKKKIGALEEERRQLQLQVAELQRRLEKVPEERQAVEPPAPQPEVESGMEFPRKKLASHHKIDWERYTYLHDRYEAYVEAGEQGARARQLANEDLRARFGDAAGYTDEQLEAIFL